MGERVLVCVLAQTRAHEATWPSFQKHVLQELDADLALSIGLDEHYDFSNPFWQHARYRWTVPEPEDFGVGFDQARSWFTARNGTNEPADWRLLLAVRDNWLGGIAGPGSRLGSGAIQYYFRWLLYRHLVEEGIVQRYDRFIVTRSDYLWPVPHPPLALLAPDFLWMPDGERYGGLPDRHVIASAADILPAINLIEAIVVRPQQLAESMGGHGRWNMESYLKHHLLGAGLSHGLRFFPYVMYTVRGEADTSRWRMGCFDRELGLYVKYPNERRSAKRYEWIRSAEDWQRLATSQPDVFHANLEPPPRPKPTLRDRARRVYAWMMGRVGRV